MKGQDTYKTAYLSAIKELTELKDALRSLEERRNSLEKRITEVKRGVLALAPLCDEAPWSTYPALFPELTTPSHIGLSNAVRRVLDQDPEGWISPTAVRERLQSVGYQTKSKNILPSIHNVLKRLRDAGKVEDKGSESKGGTWYRCKPNLTPGESRSEGCQSEKHENELTGR